MPFVAEKPACASQIEPVTNSETGRFAMKIRKITSLTAALAFCLMLLTSIILYVVPQGRVAYWADWRFLGLTKTDWGNLHINLGLLFLIALSLHIYYNWKPLVSYLKDKARNMKVLTPEFNVALIVTVIFIFGTYFLVPPLSWMMALNDHFKDAGAEKYGEPPYGHAELSSLATFTKKMGLDLDRSLVLLREAGYPVENAETTLATIGQQYRIPPQRLFETIKPAAVAVEPAAESGKPLPDSPPPGSGNLTLADFCARFNLNLKLVERELKAQGVAASPASTLKAIAGDNNTSPIDLYERIKAIVDG
jgi:hypothetical protein